MLQTTIAGSLPKPDYDDGRRGGGGQQRGAAVRTASVTAEDV